MSLYHHFKIKPLLPLDIQAQQALISQETKLMFVFRFRADSVGTKIPMI